MTGFSIEEAGTGRVNVTFESPRRTDGRLNEDEEPLVQRHTVDVQPRDLTSVDINLKQLGVGGDNSWGALTHQQYRLTGKSYAYGFVISVL